MPTTPGDVHLEAYDRSLLDRGDTAGSARPPNDADRRTRFDAMLDVIDRPRESPVVLCDFACGAGDLLAHIRSRGLPHITYIGADRSAEALAHARARFGDATFVEVDIDAPNADLDAVACDYLVVNGLFTRRFGLSQDEMWSFVVAAVERLWPKVRRGLAFNVMAKAVDRGRDDLFRVPMDDAAGLLRRLAGRRVRIRADYAPDEYTAFAHRGDPRALPPRMRAKVDDEAPVPVLRPLLPSTDRLVPYLRRIDASRIYTNYGPLVCELERRLAGHFGLPAACVASASSGTAALTGAILATAGRATRARPFALMPAFTFVATAVAAEHCGYQPYLADVDAETWMLDPERLLRHPNLGEVGVVIPVAPFGRPVPQRPWREFRDRTGIPVVIDGAASFDVGCGPLRNVLGAVPVALSLHATKGFGTGEGGAVVWADPDGLERVAQALNFGFFGSRNSRTPSTNGKMSEYHAAIGLAALDGWAASREAFLGVAGGYRRAMEAAGLADRFFAAPDIGLCYALFQCRSAAEAARTQEELRRGGIDWRLWYGGGLHRQSYFAAVARDRLDTTDEVAPTLLGLPMAPDLREDQIAQVAKQLSAAVRGSDFARPKRLGSAKQLVVDGPQEFIDGGAGRKAAEGRLRLASSLVLDHDRQLERAPEHPSAAQADLAAARDLLQKHERELAIERTQRQAVEDQLAEATALALTRLSHIGGERDRLEVALALATAAEARALKAQVEMEARALKAQVELEAQAVKAQAEMSARIVAAERCIAELTGELQAVRSSFAWHVATPFNNFVSRRPWLRAVMRRARRAIRALRFRNR